MPAQVRDRHANRRIRLLLALFTIAFAAMFARAFWLQGVQAAHLSGLARSQHEATQTIPAGRGTVYDRTGIRLLNILDLGALLGGADDGDWGVLNLVGTTNPIGSAKPNYVVWGTVADWSNSYYVVWGTAMQNSDGEYVVWGTGDYGGEYVVWGTSVTPDK